jgi:Fic family protein
MRIIKRKKGINEYYYLQHSVRLGRKIVTKEKYLGKIVPANIKERMLKLKKEMPGNLNKKLEMIKRHFQAEWKKIPESAKRKEKEEISISFTYNTNAIEGSTITLEETREIIKDQISPNKPLRDISETEAHNLVFLEMFGQKKAIDNKRLLDWHKKIFEKSKPDIAGKYRDYLVRVGDYLAPDWQEVKGMMNNLLEFINSSKINPVELSARAHYRFEKIHPFGDGNGRIGRLIMNDILWHKKYPMIIIEYKKRMSYYKALQRDEDGFASYFIRRFLSIHKKRYLRAH